MYSKNTARWEMQREQFRAKIDTKWRQRCQAFFLFLVNSWAQVRSQWFVVKEISKYLLQLLYKTVVFRLCLVLSVILTAVSSILSANAKAE
jgi:hypothetical protein